MHVIYFYIKPLASATSTSLTSKIDSTPSVTECTPDSIFFLTHKVQCQAPGGKSSSGGSKQER